VVFGIAANIGLVIAAGIATTISTVVQSNFTHIYQAELFHTANRSTAIGIPYAASRHDNRDPTARATHQQQTARRHLMPARQPLSVGR
jgi:hypothetical protein